MIYEYRVYTVLQGRMRDLQQRFDKVVFPAFERNGMKTVAAWTPLIGGRSDKFIYMLAYDTLGDREKTWTSFRKDPAWGAEREKGGQMIAHEENAIYVPTSFPPLK